MASRPVNLPPGFVLEQPNQQQTAKVSLPPGFVLEQPTQAQPKQEKPGFWGNLSESFGLPAHPLDELGKEVKDLVNHPVDSLTRAAKNTATLPVNLVKANRDVAQKGFEEWKRGQYGPAVADVIYSAIPVLGPTMSKAGEQLKTGDYAGGAGTMTGLGIQAALVTPAGRAGMATAAKAPVKAVQKLNPRGMMADRMAQPVDAGSTITRGDLLNAARENGINLDLADATDSKVARTVKRANQFSLGGASTYEKNAAANRAALENWANRLLEETSSTGASREAVGNIVKDQLLKKQAELNDAAGQYFTQVDKTVGAAKPDLGMKLDAYSGKSVRQIAKDILAENQGYYQQFPEMLPGKAWKIVQNIAGNKGATWSDLQKLRSDILKEVQSPELVGSRAEGWLKHLEGGLSEVLDRSAEKLSPLEAQLYQKGNARWQVMKQTYDNPQHPFYHIVRALDGTRAGNAASNLNPEFVRQLREALNENAMGVFERDQLSRVLSPKEGQPFSFDTLNQRIGRTDLPRLEEALGAQNARKVALLGKVAKKVTADVNPSGSARVGVGAVELANMFSNPIVGSAELGGNYAAARAINSPRFVDWLTMPAKEAVKMKPGALKGKAVPAWMLMAGANAENKR